MTAKNVTEKLAMFSDHWSPKILTTYNNNDIMVAKFQGEYHWHSHLDTDGFFMVLKGEIELHLRDKIIHMKEGDVYVVPAGVEHRPVAKEEAHILLIEPIGTPNSGDEKTAAKKVLI